MERNGMGQRLKATAFFSALGAGGMMLVLTLLTAVALVFGEAGSLGSFLRPLFWSGIVGAVGGGLFAGGVSLLGRRGEGNQLSHGAATVAGASAAFLSPLLIVLVLFNPQSVSLLEILPSYLSGAWWLAGLGGAVGLGLNHMARRASLGPVEPRGEIEPPEPGDVDAPLGAGTGLGVGIRRSVP